MNKRNGFRLLACTAVGLVVVLSGCQQDEDQAAKQHGEIFPGPYEPRTPAVYADAHAAAGARTDSTLRSYHFDKGELNSLGREKLDQMVRDDDACDPLVVYVDARGESGLRDEWENAVAEHLKVRGLTDEQISFKSGPNMSDTTPSAPALRGLRQMESPPAGTNGNNGSSMSGGTY